MVSIRNFVKLKYLLSMGLLVGCSSQMRREIRADQPSAREVTVAVIKDDKEISDFDLNVYYLKGQSTDTVRLTSDSNRISIPLYDSTIQFFRARYDDYTMDFSGLFLQYELPTFLHPKVSNWYMVVDTPPFQGQRQDLDPNEIKYVVGLYVDAEFSSGVSVPMPHNDL